MALDSPIVWWILTGVLVGLELATGTFYLLMLALGTAVGAIAAHAGLGSAGQMTLAALAGGGAVLGWYLRNRRRPPVPPAQHNPDMLLDIGCTVQVDLWSPDGSASVTHRGARWAARWTGEGQPAPGPHVIRGLEGSCLLLGR